MRIPSTSLSSILPWSIILSLALTTVDGRNVTDFVNATHAFVGTDVSVLTPDVDAERVIFLTFRERAPLAILYPFHAFATTQVRRTLVPGQDGVFRLCRADDPTEEACIRPGAVYVPETSPNTGGASDTIEIGTPPFVPSDVTAQVLNSSAVTLAWTNAAPADIDHYECYVYWNDNFGARANAPLPDARVLDSLHTSLPNISSTANRVTIAGLPPYSWLRVDFVAVHKLGTYGYRSIFTATRASSLTTMPVSMSLTRGTTSISVVVPSPNQFPDVINDGEVEVNNTSTNETALIRVRLLEAAIQGTDYLIGRVGALHPFTSYSFRLRLFGNQTGTATQFSEAVFAVSPATVQPPMAFEESRINEDPENLINITWVPQPKYDANITIRLRLFDPEGIDVEVILCSNCTYLVLPAGEVRTNKIRFLSGVAMNSVGNSTGSGLFRLRTQDPASRSSDNTLTIALATVLPIVLALAIMTAILYRKWRTRYVYQVLKFPDVDEWEVPRDRVVVDFRNELGHGAFGIVFGGHLLVDLEDLPAGTAVAIKTLRNEASDERKMELIEEAARMKRLGRHTHPNVIQLYAVCLQAQPLLVIMEYAPHGTLRAYASENDLSVAQQVRAVLDVAKGMAYLSEQDFVHRDLAARNCMVGHNYVVKVADFGLARDIHYLHYYRKTGSVVLPVRWMAPECMVEGKFDAETDVWSFGVVVWEVFAHGRLPYEEMSNDQVYEAVIRGLRLLPPKDMPPFIGEVLKSCFALERPSFKSLAHVLQRYCIDNNIQTVREVGDGGEGGNGASGRINGAYRPGENSIAVRDERGVGEGKVDESTV